MEISNYADVINSSDIIERIEELEAELEELTETGDADEFDGAEELRILSALASDASDYADDWKYGVTLIRDSYFTEWAEELAEEIGAYDSSAVSWPLTHIDWDAAAEDLQQDYTSVDFDGVDYWVR